MKNIILISLISILSAVFVSSLGGIISYLTYGNFWVGFCLLMIIYYFIGWLYNLYLTRVFDIKKAEIEKENNTALAYQNVELACTYCNANNITRLAFNKNNTFKCGSCDQENIVKIEVMTVRSTKPVIAADTALQTIFKNIDEIPKQVEQKVINTVNRE